MRPVVALTATEWATLLGIPTAIVVAVLGPLIQRRAQEKRDQQQNQGGLVGSLIKGYEGRIRDLRDQIAADKAEFQTEIAQERAEREAEVAAARVECEQRVADLHQRHTQQLHEVEARYQREMAELERRLRAEADLYRDSRDKWRAKAEGKINGRGQGPDDTPPPEGRRS